MRIQNKVFMTVLELLHANIYKLLIFHAINLCYEGLKFNQTSFRAFHHVFPYHSKTKMQSIVARLFNNGNLKSFFYCLAAHDCEGLPLCIDVLIFNKLSRFQYFISLPIL